MTTRILFSFIVALFWISVGTSHCKAQFTTIIDVPPDILNPIKLAPDTQLNIFESGLVVEVDAVGENIEVNLNGGAIGSEFPGFGGLSVFRDGSIVNVMSGNMNAGSFRAGCYANLCGGTANVGFVQEGAVVNVDGGQFTCFSFEGHGDFLDGTFEIAAFRGSDIVVRNGTVLGEIYTQSKMWICGGSVGSFAVECGTGQMGISGGASRSETTRFRVTTNGSIRIAGGSFPNAMFSMEPDSPFELVGGPFFLNGVELTDLPIGTATRITEAKGILTAVLTDGSSFEIDFDSNVENMFGYDELTFNVIPQYVLGDVNGDLFVRQSDIAPFVQLLQSGQYQEEADINQDGSLDLIDVLPFVQLLNE